MSVEPRRRTRDLIAWLLEERLSVIVAAAVAVVVAKNGLNVFPSPTLEYMQEIARHWTDPKSSVLFHSHFADYLLGSPTSAIVAGILHLTSIRAFLAFHLAVALLALFSPFFLRAVRTSRELRTAVLLFVVGGPTAAVLLTWVGSYDPVSVGAAAVAALAASPLLAALGWAVFAFNNAPEALLGLVAYSAVLVAADGRRAVRRLVTGSVGALLGYLGIRTLTHAWGASTVGIGTFHNIPFHTFAKNTTDFWPLIIFSSLGVGWLLFGHPHLVGQRTTKAVLAVTVLASLTVPFIALDETRVVSGILWPAALLGLDRGFSRLTQAEAHAVLRRVALPAVIVPVVVVWQDSLIIGWRGMLHTLRLVLT
jgi:hypothetical protein